MKLRTNTIVPKLMKMRSEIEIIQKTIEEVVSILNSNDSLEFAKKADEFIQKFPKLEYLNEEMESIKECLIDVYDGYEKRQDALLYMHFIEKVVRNSIEYIN